MEAFTDTLPMLCMGVKYCIEDLLYAPNAFIRAPFMYAACIQRVAYFFPRTNGANFYEIPIFFYFLCFNKKLFKKKCFSKIAPFVLGKKIRQLVVGLCFAF